MESQFCGVFLNSWKLMPNTKFMLKIISDYIPLIFLEVGALIILDFHCLKTKKWLKIKLVLAFQNFILPHIFVKLKKVITCKL